MQEHHFKAPDQRPQAEPEKVNFFRDIITSDFRSKKLRRQPQQACETTTSSQAATWNSMKPSLRLTKKFKEQKPLTSTGRLTSLTQLIVNTMIRIWSKSTWKKGTKIWKSMGRIRSRSFQSPSKMKAFFIIPSICILRIRTGSIKGTWERRTRERDLRSDMMSKQWQERKVSLIKLERISKSSTRFHICGSKRRVREALIFSPITNLSLSHRLFKNQEECGQEPSQLSIEVNYWDSNLCIDLMSEQERRRIEQEEETKEQKSQMDFHKT